VAAEAPAPGAPGDTLALLAQLVALDSQNPGAGEREVAAFVAEAARERGFAVRMVEGAPGRTNVIAEADAGGPRSLALCAHLDTKPIGDAAPLWDTDPLRLEIVGERAFGLGTSDMKAAAAALLSATTRWSRGTAPAGRVQLVFCADEEAGSMLGAGLLAARGEVEAEAMIVAEPSGIERSWEALYTVSRGMTCFTVTIRGTQGHSALAEQLGTSATVAAARMIAALEDFEPTFPSTPGVDARPTVSPAVRIEGGVFYGVHPGEARFDGEVRLVPGMKRPRFDRELRACLDAALAEGVSYELSYADGTLGWTDASQIDPAHPLVASAGRAAASVLGEELPLAAYPGDTDASRFSHGAGIPAIASLGPGLLSVAHGANEYVPLADLEPATEIYRLAIDDYLS
jgi:acetylornithine deacetylase/succinyl-diaminopimelate desuccinylase-like protein